MRLLRDAVTAVAVALFAAAPARGQSVPRDPAMDMASLVSGRVAALWGVDGAAVVVELGPAGTVWPPEGARDVELVGSGSGGHWVVRSDVPGDPGVRARVGVRVDVTVAARALPRGHVLDASDLSPGREVRWGPPGAHEVPVEPGWRTLGPVAEGAVLRAPVVQPPRVVHAGDAVVLRWRRGPVSVESAGTAAGAASVGGEVTVRTRNGDRLRGVVVAPGVVDITQGGGR
jgi:flagella basal body P-ring formation protein FlgA